jgi:hypothetical protein
MKPLLIDCSINLIRACAPRITGLQIIYIYSYFGLFGLCEIAVHFPQSVTECRMQMEQHNLRLATDHSPLFPLSLTCIRNIKYENVWLMTCEHEQAEASFATKSVEDRQIGAKNTIKIEK